jgi:protein gp37
MSVSTLIQWTDDTVNPVMGCSAPCELRPTPTQAREIAIKFFSNLISPDSSSEIEKLLGEMHDGRNATEIYQLRGETLDAVFALLDGPAAGLPKVEKDYKAALDEKFICYAHQQTMMRGSDITNPYKRTTPGFPQQFEKVSKYAGRMADFAMRPDLYGQLRPSKPWLDYLPRVLFVSDMADALSEEIEFDYLKQEIIDVVSTPRGRQHLWLWLTKMPWRMAEFAVWLKKDYGVDWPDNLVAMTSVTSTKTVVRARQLLEVPARFRGLSVEPLWGDVTLPLKGIDWCIVGGQSGAGSQPFEVEWIKSLQRQCKKAGTALFVKQLGACPVSGTIPIELKDEHGGNWTEWPVEFRVREMPVGFRTLRALN